VLGLVCLVVVITIALLVSLQPGYSEPKDFSVGYSKGKDAIWIDVVWSARPQSDEDIRKLVTDIEHRGFRYVYVYVNSLEVGGLPKASTYAHAKEFLQTARETAPELVYLGWIGIVNVRDGEGKVDLTQPVVRANVANYCHELVTQIGFDGVQLDVEPVTSGNQDYLDLLSIVRETIGTHKLLSIAAHKWRPDLIFLEAFETSYWSGDYFSQVAAKVDQLAVMGYDTYLNNPMIYRGFMQLQTTQIIHSVAQGNAEVLIGIPTYDEARANHDPKTENIDNALRGIIAALNGDQTVHNQLAGVSVYADWTTDADEWTTYEQLWLGH
jgi:spore germination protein YaaH